ncbi:MAG: ABC transporter ATP-binding protein/permease [Gammaproteobacteria bacterium]|nr:ABC transporter ATP-binding protein/permease [Gammaproteobacteria bacterium]
MFPYVWDFKGRVLAALAFLMLAKLATVGIPLLLKEIVDYLEQADRSQLELPIVLLLSYGFLRLVMSLFNELRDVVFARVRYGAMRKLSKRVLEHLHQLSLRFHLDRNTGSIVRDLERGAQSVSSMVNYLVFNIFPTAAEFILVAVILLGRYEIQFALVTVVTVALYVFFTLMVTEWRMHFRHEMNALDSKANGLAVDSLLNYETVKYFNNEAFELRRYDSVMDDWIHAGVKSQSTMSLLNFGQGAIIAVGVTAMIVFATQGVINGSMTLGDLVLVNAMMLQLFMPLSFLGVIYRALKYSLADMDMVNRLLDKDIEVKDAPNAGAIHVLKGAIEFKNVSFSYQPERKILNKINFTIPAGHKVAIVGPSGAGKSTVARLLFRFYDASDGAILIDGQDIRLHTQASLRESIGIVPQDTVLFNHSIFYNIQYADTSADKNAVIEAAKLADIHDFIINLPEGYDTIVGERGLKLSGGEKQRVAIARVILKRPRILVFDEATSSLDSRSEKAILASLKAVSSDTSTLVIAHRLSTIVDAEQILVLDHGEIQEQGTHVELIALGGLYQHLWELQQQEESKET